MTTPGRRKEILALRPQSGWIGAIDSLETASYITLFLTLFRQELLLLFIVLLLNGLLVNDPVHVGLELDEAISILHT